MPILSGRRRALPFDSFADILKLGSDDDIARDFFGLAPLLGVAGKLYFVRLRAFSMASRATPTARTARARRYEAA
jgi:hypothetical protein